MSDITELRCRLRRLLPDADLACVPMPQSPKLKLWLIDPAIMDRPLTEQEIDAVWETPAYWCFAWASGQVLAKMIFDQPQLVRGKTVLDFGAGSGLVAIAAKMAGAKKVVACDLDPDALAACRANAALNGVELDYLEDFFQRRVGQPEPFDVLFAGDVLYDWDNLPLVDQFMSAARHIIIGDSRVKEFRYAAYSYRGIKTAVTLPDMGELEEFSQVKVYRAGE